MSQAQELASRSRLAVNRLGLLVFLGSEGFLFLILIGSRFLIAGSRRPDEVNQALGALLTLVLLASSGTALLAERSARAGNRPGFLRLTLVSMLLAGVFVVVLVGVDWVRASAAFGVGTPYGSLYFLLSGTHLLHLLAGLLVLGLVYLAGHRGDLAPEGGWEVQGVIWYWHFVNLVWLPVFATLYLVG